MPQVVQIQQKQIRVIREQNVRVKLVFGGPPGRNGSAAKISSDSDNELEVGTDGGLFYEGLQWTTSQW